MPALRSLLLALSVAATPVFAADTQPVLTGDLRIHDPSVIEVDGGFVAFATGTESGRDRAAIRTKSSPDGLAWTDRGTIGKTVPAWAREVLGFQPRNIWAPSVSKRGDTYFLYYSLSLFGLNTSAIGLMTSTALDPEKPADGWVDQGLVLKSNVHDNFNAIDPWRIDTSDGRAFLAFGSFWDGIRMQELDPVSGKLVSEETPVLALASRQGAGIEAASILEHEGRFYLFVSFDQCCRGLTSTYNIRVGRADAVTGPYLDRDGRPMLEGGGTLLLGTTGPVIGPGGQEAIHTSTGDRLAYHYYDGDNAGVARLQLSPIHWSTDGWPELDPVAP